MKCLVLGGSKSGKSYFSQETAKRLSQNGGGLFYLATMNPVDSEDQRRIARHRAERAGWGFETLEYPRRITDAAKRLDSSSVLLLDSVTSLLTNEMFAEMKIRIGVENSIFDDISAVADRTGDIVLVSDLLFSDALFYDKATEGFRRGLGHLNQRLAELCDTVVILRQSMPQYIKGTPFPKGETE